MTICIAAICERGSSLALATDTMITNQALSVQFEHPTKKVTRLSDSSLALTAGDALAHTELFNMVQGEITKLKAPSVVEIVDRVKDCYQHIRKNEIKERILTPRGFDGFEDFYRAQKVLQSDVALMLQSQIDSYDYGLSILVAGVDKGVAHIYGIFDPGTSKCFDAIGFHAIGSGLPHALNTLIARQCNQAMSLPEALLIVYEAKKMAEKAPGVGTSITDICVMNAKGITEFPRDKIAELHNAYEAWLQRDPDWSSALNALLKEIGVSKK